MNQEVFKMDDKINRSKIKSFRVQTFLNILEMFGIN